MNRRKAIFRITLGGIGIASAVAGFEWWTLYKSPDLAYIGLNKDLIAALCETILPATDTPGAKDAGVPDFIGKMIRDCTPRNEQNTFISGLRHLQAYCLAEYRLPYQHCQAKDQTAALSHFEQKDKPYQGLAGKLETRLRGRPFFTILKDYTVYGYCTSRTGAMNGLAYVYIPGSFSPCVPLQPGQKAWATN